MADLERGSAAARVDLAATPDFEVGGLRVRPAERAVEADGERRELQPRVMQVLVTLAEARPNVVSRDTLIERCWDGRIVGDDALNRCILALRHLAQDFTPAPFAIETVPRIGHRLVEQRAEAAAPAGAPRPMPRLAIAALAAILLAAAIAGLFLWQRLGAESGPATIAVLPFRNLSGGDAYFAEGLGEEIQGQLAREPAFQVAGSNAAAQFRGAADPRDVGRKLRVDYVLEGSVRAGGGTIRVNASLVNTSNGMRLWSETYDRKFADALEIQTAIGEAVASGLKRKLIRGHGAGARPINGEAYALYLEARGLLRTRKPELAKDAAGLLRRAIQLDPDFAPVWSSLADSIYREATRRGQEDVIAALPEARAAATKALRLDPTLGQAHGNLGIVLGYDTPEANRHFRRAAALDPRSSESVVWLGMAHRESGEFAEEEAAYRRAYRLDPLWHRPIRDLAFVIAERGDRQSAEGVVKTGFRDDVGQQHLYLGRIARLFGDFSEAARHFSKLANTEQQAGDAFAATLYLVGLSRRPLPLKLAALDQPRALYPATLPSAPSPADWRKRNRSPSAALVYADANLVGAKLMLNAGRARELVDTYDGPSGLLRLRRGEPLRVNQLHQAPLVALALRAAGRQAEADRLLDRAVHLVRAIYRRGPVPNWFDADASAVHAARDEKNLAVVALKRALDRGWVHAGRDDLRGLDAEPWFRSLRGHPGFEALAARLEALYARERIEAARVLKSLP